MPESQLSPPFGYVSIWRWKRGANLGFESTWAWWYLSRRQKAALAQGRRMGRWGGMPGKVPYFWLQEFGKPEVRIRTQAFMERSLRLLLGSQDEIIGRYIHARR